MLAPRSVYQYTRVLRRFRAFQVSPHAPAELTAQVRAFLEGFSPSQQRLARAALKRELQDQVPWWRIRCQPYHRNDARLYASVLRESERRHLAAMLTDPRERALIACLAVLRRSEVGRLRWSDLELDRGLLYVPNGKGGRSDWSVLPADADLALWLWRAQAPPGELVFPTRHGGEASPSTVAHWVAAIMRRTGLRRPYRGGHAFRRTFATAYLRCNRGDLRGLQKLLRHQHIATTTLYDFPDPEDFTARLAHVQVLPILPDTGGRHGDDHARG